MLLLNIFAILLIIATALPFVRTGAWWARSFDFPRGQILFFGVLLLLLLLFFYDSGTQVNHVITTGLGISVLLQIYRIYPYLPIAPRQAKSSKFQRPDQSISMISSNVLQYNRDASGLLQQVKVCDPDCFLVVEADEWWEEQLRGLEDDYPYQVLHPLSNTYGMLLYSRFPLLNTEVKFLIDEGIPSIFATVTLPSGESVGLICLHPRPPRPDKMQDSTDRDAELLIAAKYIQHNDQPFVVIGDFNDVAWSYTTRLFQRISGLLDPRRGRGFFNTFHAKYPLLRYPLDHVFHSAEFRVIKIKRLPYIGSDHFPIYAHLNYEPDISQNQSAPESDEEDEQEARSMIREAFE